MRSAFFNRLTLGLLLWMLGLSLFPAPTAAAPSVQGEDPKAQADKLFNEGYELLLAGRFPEALPKFEAALPLYQQAGDRSGEASSLHWIGFLKYRLSDYIGALKAFQAEVPIRQQIGDRPGEAEALNGLTAAYGALGQYGQALPYAEQALAIAQEIGDRVREATALNNIATIYQQRGQYAQALDYLQQALALRREIGDRGEEASVLRNIGAVYYGLGQYAQALEYFQQALAIWQDTGKRAEEGKALLGMGNVYFSLGQFTQALDYYQQALANRREFGDRSGEANSLHRIGTVYGGLGQYAQALDYFQQALVIQQDVGDRDGEGGTLTDIGIVYQWQGHFEQALDYLQQALTIAQNTDYRRAEASALNSLGSVYSDLGQFPLALDYYQRALAIRQEIGDQSGEATTLHNIGVIYDGFGQHEKALDDYQQALKIEQDSGNRVSEGRSLGAIGRAYYALEQYEQALDYMRRALVIAQDIGDRDAEMAALRLIGLVYDHSGQNSQALSNLQQALAVAQDIGDRGGELGVLDSLGLIYEHQGNRVQAIAYDRQAIEVLESVQSGIKTQELKASFVAQYAAIYERLNNLLWDEGRFDEAFDYAERARARTFLDQLAGGAVDFRAGASTELLDRESALKAEIASRRDQLVTLRNHPRSQWDTSSIAAAQAELTDLEGEYANLLTELKLQSPEVASLVSADVASLRDVQSLLDSDTTLVEYFVTERRTLVFIITREALETVAVDVSRDDLTQTIALFRDFANLDDPHPASLRQLHAWLIAPLKPYLHTPVLGIIPHHVLHYLPFAALTDGERYLSDEYVLFTLPSASVLRFLQERRKPKADSLLALGNPTITEPLPELHFAEQEVETIAELFGTQARVGTSATESIVRAQAADVSILHLAAHGQYNLYNPLFTTIHLAGDADNDGRLEVHEIYGLDLTAKTDLVVLSACRTQVGAVSAGDEVVGLTRAFLFAGTPSVIASLWNVDDAATALLMKRFYTHLRAGLGKAEALQQAQLEVRIEYPHPYYWAAFVLTGDPGMVTGKAVLSEPTPTVVATQAPTPGGVGGPCSTAALPIAIAVAVNALQRRRLRKARAKVVVLTGGMT